MKKLALAVFVLCLGFALVGCGGAQQKTLDYDGFTMEIPADWKTAEANQQIESITMDRYESPKGDASIYVFTNEAFVPESMDEQYDELVASLDFLEEDFEEIEKTTFGDYGCIKAQYSFDDAHGRDMNFFLSDTMVEIGANIDTGAESSVDSAVNKIFDSVKLK